MGGNKCSNEKVIQIRFYSSCNALVIIYDLVISIKDPGKRNCDYLMGNF